MFSGSLCLKFGELKTLIQVIFAICVLVAFDFLFFWFPNYQSYITQSISQHKLFLPCSPLGCAFPFLQSKEFLLVALYDCFSVTKFMDPSLQWTHFLSSSLIMDNFIKYSERPSVFFQNLNHLPPMYSDFKFFTEKPAVMRYLSLSGTCAFLQFSILFLCLVYLVFYL